MGVFACVAPLWCLFFPCPCVVAAVAVAGRADGQELQLATEKASKRRAERDLEEQRDLVTTYEREIAELRAQLRKIMTALQSGEVGGAWRACECVLCSK